MAHLLTSVFTAVITALALYIQTGSLFLAFVGYVAAGVTVLVLVLVAGAFEPEKKTELKTA